MKKGFTLIEALLVVALVATVIALGCSIFTSQKDVNLRWDEKKSAGAILRYVATRPSHTPGSIENTGKEKIMVRQVYQYTGEVTEDIFEMMPQEKKELVDISVNNAYYVYNCNGKLIGFLRVD